MKKALSLLLLLVALFGAQPAAIAQVVGGQTYTVGVDFPTFAAAITAINNGISGTGTITINVPRGNTYTGVLPTLNATNTSATPIVIQASGTGPAPIIQPTLNAGTIGTTALGANGDAVLRINGTDFVTLNGLEFRANNDASAMATTRIEYGVFLVKSATNACQNITIQNCAFTNFQGGATSQLTIAIYQSNLDASGNTVTVTSTGGRCENNRYYGNTINGPYHGIALLGFNDATAPNTFYDQNCEVGGYGAGTGNTITGFGGAAATAYGIFAGNQNNALISLNALTGSTTTAQINGIVSTGAVTSITLGGAANRNASTTIRQNTITLTTTATTTTNALQAIFQNAGGAAGTFANIDSNTVQNCSAGSLTTGTVRLLYSEFGGSGAAGTSNIRGNVFNNNNWSGTGASFIIREFGYPTLVNITGNTITNTTITTTGAGSLNVINAFTTAGATHNINNNVISNIAYAGGSATTPTITCINNQSANTSTINGNRITDISSTGTMPTLRGIANAGGATSLSIQQDTIKRFTTTATTSPTLNGIANTATATGIISRCQIDSLFANSATTAPDVSGITSSGASATGLVISRNNILRLTANAGATPTVVGITVSGGTLTTVHNNYLVNLFANAANATNAIIGLNITGGTTVNAYYNTIYIEATSTGMDFGSSGIFASTTPTLDLRNNVVVNLSTPSGTGLTVAYRRSTTTLTTYASTSDRNLFFAGTPSSTRLIFHDGTNSDQTLAAFKTRVGPTRDANSVTENPPFTNPSANNFAINPSTPTRIESRGAPITGITTDFFGTTRSASTPDIGAEEGNFTLLDDVPPVISYTPLTNTSSTANRVLTGFATITDPTPATGVNTTSGTRPRIYYKKSTDPNTVSGWQFTEATNASSPFDFTIDYSLLGGVSTGDVIQYFVVAQDLASTPNVGINAGTFASQPSSVALTAAAFPIGGTINSYAITPALPTAITVGTGGDYPTLTGAGGLFQAINNNALGGNTTVTIISDLTEPGTHALLPDGMAGFTLTIQPSGARVVSGNVAGAMLDFNGADGVTINGLNSGGNSLTISNASTATAASTIRFRNDATNNTVTNCTIEGSNTNTDESAATILIGTGTSSGNDNITISNNTIRAAGSNLQNFSVTSSGTAGAVNDGLTFTNNNVEGYLIGLRAVTNVGNNLTITGNSFYQPTPITTTTLNFFDIVVGSATSNNVNVSNNFVGGSAPNATGTATRSAAAQYIGIFVTTGGGTNAVNNNVVRGVAMTSTGLTTQGVFGYVLNGTMTATNNLAQDISRSSGSTGVMTGIQLQSAGNITLTNSTVRGLNYNATAATGALNGISVIATGTEGVSGCTVENLTHTGNGTTNGINSSGTVTSHTFNNNVIRALSGTNTGTTAQVRGILSTAVGTLNITNNEVRNLTAATGATGGTPATVAVGGIITNSTTTAQTITDNRVDTLTATNASAAVQINGIGVQSTSSGGTIARNRVFRLSAPSSTGTPVIDGIHVYDASASGWTVANNLVSITNGTGTNAVTIRGLRSDAASGTVNFFYNSVFVGGSAASGSANSFGLMRTFDGATLNLRNNNLFNARTGGTGAHVAIGRTGTSTFNSNYNVIFASANSSQQAMDGSTPVTFAGWQTATSGDANSVNQNPLYHSPLNLAPLPGSPSNNAGTPIAVTTDILGNARSASTPDIGAFEFAGATPTGSGSASAPTWGAIPGAFLTINSGPSSPPTATVTAQFFSSGRTGTLPGVLNQAQEYWAVGATVIAPFDVTFDLSGVVGVGNVNTIKLFRRSDPSSPWEDISALIYNRQTSPNRLSVNLPGGFSEFSLGGDGDNPLPVNLGAFTGANIPRGVELRWETISETDNAGFDVRRAEVINGMEQEWLTIASYRSTPSLAGQGTTSQGHRYAYIDEGVQVGKTYRYALRSTDLNGTVHDYPQTVTVEVTRLAPKTFVYKLEQNYPNPFNPSTRIAYQIAAPSDVRLEVFDMLGRKVATLVSERKEAGEYVVTFDATNLSSGVYLYRLQTEKFSQTKKMILMK